MDQNQIRSLSRCRGVPLGDDKYAGCAYGSGDIRPLTGLCDCPICHGSGIEGVTATFIPHSEFGDPECCGVLNGVIDGDQAHIACNECDAVIRTLSATELEPTLTEMELSLDCCSEICPHCGKASLFPGFSRMMVFTCRECGEPVKLSDDPDIDRFDECDDH